MRYISTDRKFYIFRTKSGNRLAIFKVPKGAKNASQAVREKTGELTYILVPEREVPKRLDFFGTAISAISAIAQKHFDDLVKSGGDNRPLMAQFKYMGGKVG